MRYFTLDGRGLTCHNVDALPGEAEAIHRAVRTKYTVSFYISDWEDGETAPGRNYNNSYGLRREPFRWELVLRDGSFFGFYVGDDDQNPSVDSVLSPSNPFILAEDENRTGCYRRWELIAEPNPTPSAYVFLSCIRREKETHRFTPEEFPAGIAEAVSDSFFLETETGEFSGIFCVTLKLTPEFVRNPDRVLELLSEYRPILVRS